MSAAADFAALEADRAATSRILNRFTVDGYKPFMADVDAAQGLLTEAHGILKVLSTAWTDSSTLNRKGAGSDLSTLNEDFISSALDGVASLVAMSLFIQEQAE
ncbi:hypothetical protein [Sphingomonas immobilis]|uniref:Uncharacterized protein n=1 Tax=Sphingomonas immobilis TaxID=3063997 RepID=A0ABT9A0S1_9SPHN|nr:hypothetical protein [Sphingomonas sp. CA1-15]MDO7843433.1 hypothetical protein [Sphingomonas sp. CA1-15]